MKNQRNDVVNAADDALPPLGSVCLSEVVFPAMTAIRTVR